jgi:hypothetical protein
MKKFFTLIAMALVAVCANAKLTVDFSSKIPYGQNYEFGNWEWIGLVVAEGEPVISGETADDSNVTYFDASAYDYLCIKYNSCTENFNFIMQYKCLGTVGQYGTNFDTVTETIQANTSGLVAIQLDPAKKNTINQIALQVKAGSGSIVIDEIYWATEAEYTADAAANPVVPYVAQTKDINLANATGGWGDKTYDASTHTATLTGDNACSGWWIGGDFSAYDYIVYEIENMTTVGYSQYVLFGANKPLTNNMGSFVQVVNITEFERNVPNGMNFGIQGGAGTTWTWKRVYFATAEYVQQNGIKDEVIYGDTQELTLANLNAGWNATYDAQTKTITVGAEGEDGGKGWWFGEGADAKDLSHFDNVVIEFEPTTFEGEVLVEYSAAAAPGANRAGEVGPGVFGVGATCVVVPLDAAQKSHVKSIQVKGSQGASFTLKSAYAAIASATPEANIGTITGIETVEANALQNNVRFNMAGQKVDNSYKGVVIMNGKKVVMK